MAVGSLVTASIARSDAENLAFNNSEVRHYRELLASPVLDDERAPLNHELREFEKTSSVQCYKHARALMYIAGFFSLSCFASLAFWAGYTPKILSFSELRKEIGV